MANFVADLSRGNIYGIGTGRVFAAWGLAHFVDLMSQIFTRPARIGHQIVIPPAMRHA